MPGSGTTRRVTHVPVATSIWHCDSNFITCPPYRDVGEHLLKFYEAGYAFDMRRLVGHGFAICKQCRPYTYIFGVFTNQPSPMVTCYEISKDCYDEWQADDRTLTTPEMLHRLRDPEGRSYNPMWLPPRNGR